ncbi:MAG: FMN-binding protein [Eubacteriales bacterium]
MSRTFCRIVCLIALTALLAGCSEGNTNSTVSSDTVLSTTSAPEPPDTAPTYQDGTIYKGGTFEGIGYGKNGPIQLTVTLDNDKIIAIDLIAQCETESIFAPAYESIKSAVLNKENPDLSEVDSVSGATMSCQGILDAIKAALFKARL